MDHAARTPAPLAIDVDDVRAAAARLAGVAHRTPVITSAPSTSAPAPGVFLKAENLQRVGAFKFRGAYNRVASLGADELRPRRRPPSRRATTPRRSPSPPGCAERGRRS